MSVQNTCELETKSKKELKKIKKYNCIYLNDDKTSFDFVKNSLISVFHRTEEEAWIITLAIHNADKGIANKKPLSKDIAETKRDEVLALAKEEGYPLRVIVDEAI